MSIPFLFTAPTQDNQRVSLFTAKLGRFPNATKQIHVWIHRRSLFDRLPRNRRLIRSVYHVVGQFLFGKNFFFKETFNRSFNR